MRTYHYGNFINIEIGQEVTVARTGGGHTVFGEPATLTRTTKQHLVFTTKSEKTVKCPIDNMSLTVGKAHKSGYFIILKKFEDVENIIHSSVMF